MWQETLRSFFINKKTAIIGFGREGVSTYSLLRRLMPETLIYILDKNDEIKHSPVLSKDANCIIITGETYLENIKTFDILIKSPGISSKEFSIHGFEGILTSQSGLFLKCFASQVIGITGTKGKSTTSSLLTHVLRHAGRKSVFVGNIGVPPFDEIENIEKDTLIVYEMSSHQLETVKHSPHISVLLNIFQEHLDHYSNYESYQNAKFNIVRFQKEEDYFLYNADNEIIKYKLMSIPPETCLLPFTFYKTHSKKGCYIGQNFLKLKTDLFTITYDNTFERHILGAHNLLNCAFVIMICKILGIEENSLFDAIATFKGLPHRLQFVGEFNKKIFYNDSIATIPEAVIVALETLNNVETLIAGGFDRGIDYETFINYLNTCTLKNIVLTGTAGKRIFDSLKLKGRKECYYFSLFDVAVKCAISVTSKGGICLLSPAASSYDCFKNFEERGRRFVELISHE